MSSKAIPQGSTVLISGTTGFIGSHIADQTLRAGYRVRATVRNAEKSAWLSEFFTQRYGQGTFETVVVPTMEAPDALAEAAKGVAGIIHTASVVNFSPDPYEVIPPTVEGALNALRAAAGEQSVKRVVFTSSSAAAVMPTANVRFNVDSSSWNREAKDQAYTSPPWDPMHGWPVYCQSKVEAEEGCWNFMKEKNPGFVLNTVLPNVNIGEILHPNISGGATGGMMKKVWEGNEKSINDLLELDPQYYINVTDTARVHVAALIEPDVKGERLFAFAEAFNCNDILDAMRKIDPKKGDNLPENKPNASRDLSIVDNRRALEALQQAFGRQEWETLEQSIRENVGLAHV